MRVFVLAILCSLAAAQDTRGTNMGAIPAHTYASTRGKAEGGEDLWSVGEDEPSGVDELGNPDVESALDKARYSNLNIGVKQEAKVCDAEHNERSSGGKMAVWVGFMSMGFTAAYIGFETSFNAFTTPEAKRQMWVTFFVCLIACLAYLTMGTGNGIYRLSFDCDREFFYARYVDWALTTPLMLLELTHIAGSSNNTKYWLCGIDFIMVISGLVGAFVDGSSKYLFFLFGMLVFAPIIYFLVGDPQVAADQSPARKALFSKVALLTALTWAGYPLAWVLCEGTGEFSVDYECYLYTVLDVLSKCFFGVMIVQNRLILGGVDMDALPTAGSMDRYLANNLNNWSNQRAKEMTPTSPGK